MRRCMRGRLAAVALALLVAFGTSALAHVMDLFGYVTVDEQGTVVARLVDVYGGLVEGQRVELYARPPGGRATKPVVMEEIAPGTYRGRVVPEGAPRYAVTIDLALGGDLHRIELEVEAGAAVPEQFLAMAQIDPRWPWTRVLFVAAAVVLDAGSWVAWRRRPAGPEPDVVEGGVAE